MIKKNQPVSEFRVFQSLPDSVKNQIEMMSFEKQLKKGEYVFRKGESAEYVWFVKRGRIQLFHHSFQGVCQTFCVITNGELFCCIPALDLGRHLADAVAVVDSALIGIQIRFFHKLLEEYPTFLNEALRSFCARIRLAETRKLLQRFPAENRIADVLVQFSEKYFGHIPMSKQEIADIAGTTVETTIRTLSSFKKRGWIESRRCLICVKDIDKIKALADLS